MIAFNDKTKFEYIAELPSQYWARNQMATFYLNLETKKVHTIMLDFERKCLKESMIFLDINNWLAECNSPQVWIFSEKYEYLRQKIL